MEKLNENIFEPVFAVWLLLSFVWLYTTKSSFRVECITLVKKTSRKKVVLWRALSKRSFKEVPYFMVLIFAFGSLPGLALGEYLLSITGIGFLFILTTFIPVLFPMPSTR